MKSLGIYKKMNVNNACLGLKAILVVQGANSSFQTKSIFEFVFCPIFEVAHNGFYFHKYNKK
jgi:hypothetical protein